MSKKQRSSNGGRPKATDRHPVPRADAAASRPWWRVALVPALALLVLAGGAGVWWWQHRAPTFTVEAGADQNVVLVTIDTLRADVLSCYGGPVQTPNLDALAAHGARFTFAHSSAVVTLVSHTTILTGLYPYQHGVRDNVGFRVPAGTVTLASRLKPLGFTTGAFIGGFTLTKRFGLAPGFDVYDDQVGEMHGLAEISMPERRADAVVGRALDWINKQPGKFFAWVHVFDPHSPYRPPAEWLAKYPTQPYYGEVAWSDYALGALFDRLATLPRRTLVIVTADHGEGLGDHGELTHGLFAYESTLHIPLIIAEIDPHAAQAPHGVVIDAPVRHVDIAPTVLDAVGAPRDPSLPGSSLLDLIRTGRSPDRPEYFEAMSFNLTRGWAPLRGVLVSRDKYIDLPIPELYNLGQDPHETHNLATELASRVQVLYNTLKTYSIAPPGRPGQESPSVSAALRSLGYASGNAAPREQYTEADDPKTLVHVDMDEHKATDLYEAGDVDQAIVMFKKVLAEQPAMSDASTYLAYVYWQQGRVDEAIATLDTAIKHGVTDRDVRLRLGIYLSLSGKDVARGIAVLKSLPDDDVEVLNGLGLAYQTAGRNGDALAVFRKILTLDPTNGLAYQNIAVIQLQAALALPEASPERAKQLEEVEATLEQALEIDPKLPDAYNTLGVVLEDTGRHAQAIDAWKQAVGLDPTQYNALENLVLTLAQQGRLDEAQQYGQQFLRTAPQELYGKDMQNIRRVIGG